MTQHRVLLICILVAVALGLCWAMFWRSKSIAKVDNNPIINAKTEDRSEKSKTEDGVKELVQHLQPSPATEQDWKLLQIQTNTTSESTIKLPFGFATGVLPLYEAPKGVNVADAKIQITRSSNGIESRHWVRGAGFQIKIDWREKKLDRISRTKDEKLDFPVGLEYKDTTTNETNFVMIVFGRNPKDRKQEVIALDIYENGTPKGQSKLIPYHHSGFRLLAPYSTSGYPIAVCPKAAIATDKLETIMLFDIDRGALICEIPIPESAKTDRPCFSIDTNSNVLAAISYYLGWCLLVDLEPCVKK